MTPHVLGFLPSWGGAYVPPRWLWLEVRQLQPQLMVNVKLQCSWSVVCAPRCGSLKMLVHRAPQSLTSWGSPAGTPWYLGQAHSQQHRATPTSSPGSLQGQQLWTRSSCNAMRGPMWELHAWAHPKSWPARSPGEVAKGGSNLHTAAVMHMYHQMDAQPGAQEGSSLTRRESRALGRLLEHPTPRCLLKDPRNRGWGDKSKGSGWGAVTRKWQPDPGLIPQPHIRVRVVCHTWGGELSLSQGWQLGKPTSEGVIVNSVTSAVWDGLPTEAHDTHTDVPVSPCEPHCTQVRKHRLKTKFISTVK